MNKAAPIEMPTEVIARALPLFSMNHFAGGTEVTIDPGPETPANPINPKTKISCQDSLTKLNEIIEMPVIKMHMANIHLAPYLSSKFPKRGFVAALEKLLIVDAQPKDALLIPRESPMGFMYNPRFSAPIPIPTALAIAITTTITHP